MFDIEKARRTSDKRLVARWAKLPMPKLLEYGYSRALYSKIWFIDAKVSKVILKNAKEMQETYVKSPRKNWGGEIETEIDLLNKDQGFKGEKALHSTLNEIGIDFSHSLKNFDSTKHHDRGDTILTNSNLVIEVKTGRYYSDVLTINKEKWLGQVKNKNLPDIVFALKLLEPRDDLILVRFMGWCFSQDVAQFDVDDCHYCKQAPCFYCKYKELNQVTDIDEFLEGLSQRGTDYLNELAKTDKRQ